MPKVRLDMLLVERGLVESRAQAQRLVMAGQVRVDGQVVLKPATSVLPEALLEINQGPPFVSRGGEKLEAALATFYLDVNGLVCADVGASTGGFTDCLLQNGALRVYAIDVGHGILHWKLRQDPRVVVMERTNARHLERLPEPVDLVTIDASFISLKILLPMVKGWLRPSPDDPFSRGTVLMGKSEGTPYPPAPFPLHGGKGSGRAGRQEDEGEVSPAVSETGKEEMSAGEARGAAGQIIALIKPQFEAGRAEVARGAGVIRDQATHRQVLLDTLTFAQQEGYAVHGLLRSPLLGPKGNAEFLAYFRYPGQGEQEVGEFVEQAVTQNSTS